MGLGLRLLVVLLGLMMDDCAVLGSMCTVDDGYGWISCG